MKELMMKIIIINADIKKNENFEKNRVNTDIIENIENKERSSDKDMREDSGEEYKKLHRSISWFFLQKKIHILAISNLKIF